MVFGEQSDRGMFFLCKSAKYYQPDVFIAGGGPAGIAAVSCAREGHSVFLAEGDHVKCSIESKNLFFRAGKRIVQTPCLWKS